MTVINDMFSSLYNAAMTTVVSSIVAYLFFFSKKQVKKYSATEKGVVALLRDRIISAVHKGKEKGYLYIHERENIDKMVKEYHNLGGNGTIDQLIKEISALPTKTDLK